MDKFHERMRNRGQGGFTLIELLVVVAILAVLGGAVIIGIGTLTDSASEEVCKTDLETLNTAVEAYKVSNDGAIPTLAQLEADGFVEDNFDPADFAIDGAGDVTASAAGKYADVAADCNA